MKPWSHYFLMCIAVDKKSAVVSGCHPSVGMWDHLTHPHNLSASFSFWTLSTCLTSVCPSLILKCPRYIHITFPGKSYSHTFSYQSRKLILSKSLVGKEIKENRLQCLGHDTIRDDISACIRSILESFQWNETEVSGHHVKATEAHCPFIP